jgi:acyl-CoA thioesterase FadM
MLTYTARLIATGFGAWRAGRVAALATVRTGHRAWLGDCDPNFHMNEGRYLSVAGIARVALWVRIGLLPRMVWDGWRPAAVSSSVTFIRELPPLGWFAVESRVVTWDDKYSYYEHRFLRDETLIARVLVRSVFRRGRETIAPADVMAAAGETGAAPPMSEELELWKRMREAGRTGG